MVSRIIALTPPRLMGLMGGLLVLAATAQVLDAQAGPANVSSPHQQPVPFLHYGSGTSWGPEAPSHGGVSREMGRWLTRLHARAALVVRGDAGPRGATEWLHTSMVGGSLQGPLGKGLVQLRAMASLEPLMGARGYPLLLQTGETADGATPLIDRQHPHDFVMELAAEAQLPLGSRNIAFAYAGLVGAPAVGPTPFMHRLSAQDNPVAPISHHLLDATHISHGVVTVGVAVRNSVQLELSVFNGREPDQERWDLDIDRLDSWSLRITARPHQALSIQGSAASLTSPEQLHPGIDEVRTTLSAEYRKPIDSGFWAFTAALGRTNTNRTVIPVPEARATFPAPVFDHYFGIAGYPPDFPEEDLLLLFPARVSIAGLGEIALRRRRWTAFTRVEAVRKAELLALTDPRHSRLFTVGRASLGGSLALAERWGAGVELGGSLSWSLVPEAIRDAYGSGLYGGTAFARWVL